METNVRTSFSQSNMFTKCPRAWYYSYVLKIRVVSDMCYADAGKVLHDILQKWYNGEVKTLDELKIIFHNMWKIKKLDETKIKHKVDDYWLQIINGINLNINLTSTEFKVFFPDVVGYFDGVNTITDEIIDWKSSTRSEENEEEYKLQMQFYSYLYYRKFNRIPSKLTVYYLKHNGSKSELSFVPSMDDILRAEEWHNYCLQEMSKIYKTKSPPPITQKGCYGFCPYGEHCKINKETFLKFTLYVRSAYIYIHGEIAPLLHRGLYKKFSYELKNAHWIKKAHPNANTIVNFWDYKRKVLPIGFLSGVVKTLSDYAVHTKNRLELEIVDERIFNDEQINMPEKFINGKELRDYQIEATTTFLGNKIGVLEIGTGGGKTEIAIEAIRRLRYKTLFIVDKIELLKQTKKRIEDSLGIEVGIIGQNEVNIKHITVATVQTLNKRLNEFSQYLQSIRFVIFDETHKVAAKSYLKLGRHLINSEYRLGISGTAFRDDGNDLMITATTGYKVFDLSSTYLIERGWLIKPTIIFLKNYIPIEDEYKIENMLKDGLINETANYQNYYDGLITKNIFRNNQIKKIVDEHNGKKILILTRLIEHGTFLKELIPGSDHLWGETGKDARKDILEKFINGDLNVLISTISIFSEGIDIPNLQVVINASANKGSVKTIQVLGRVLRTLEGKQNAYYVDFIDNIKFFKVASYARRKALLNEGHDIEIKNCGKQDNQ